MKLLLPSDIASQLTAALLRGGKREIGGVLMGEHVSTDTFRVKQITIQFKGGTFSTFVRLVEELLGPLRAFFRETNHDYTRFNYLGEWHSHHSFALNPSNRDHTTMRELATDPGMGARFVVLVLARLDGAGQLEHSVTVYPSDSGPRTGVVIGE